MPMPWGRRPFTAALIRSGARKASEMDGHVGLPDAAFLASAKFCDRGYPPAVPASAFSGNLR